METTELLVTTEAELKAAKEALIKKGQKLVSIGWATLVNPDDYVNTVITGIKFLTNPNKSTSTLVLGQTKQGDILLVSDGQHDEFIQNVGKEIKVTLKALEKIEGKQYDRKILSYKLL